MQRAFPAEFVYQVFSLIIAFIIVHAVYVAVLRPNADRFLEQEFAQMKADREYVPRRSIYVLVRDYEQEACFVLMLWAFAILGYKGVAIYRQRRLLDDDLILPPQDRAIRPGDVPELAQRIHGLPASVQYFPAAVCGLLMVFFAASETIFGAPRAWPSAPSSTSTLLGFRSRCTTPFWCAW